MATPSAVCNYGTSGSNNSSTETQTGIISMVDTDAHGQAPAFRVIDPNETVITSGTMGGYEELFGGTMVCPTCNGKGRISRGNHF